MSAQHALTRPVNEMKSIGVAGVMRTRRLLLLLVAVLSTGFYGNLRAQSAPHRPAVAVPVADEARIPLLQQPFAADWPVNSVFDHDLPFEFEDTNGYLLSFWGARAGGIDGHDGYDWMMPEGTPLLAAADGAVTVAGAFPVRPGSCPLKPDASPLLMVAVVHTADGGQRFTTEYLHLSRVDVQTGEEVSAGQVLGLSGDTGCSTAPHLHFAVRRHAGTNNGRAVRIDPYGWQGSGDDPWAAHPNGAPSVWLWKDGQAPLLWRQVTLAPNPNPTDSAPVALTMLVATGFQDERHPNNEYVELTLDPRFAQGGRFTLTGFTLRNNSGDMFTFPDGFTIEEGRPVRVYSGEGQNTNSELYWNRGSGAWDDLGDCARLVRPDGRNMYRLAFRVRC